jgi:signal transduction histidine kinase
MSQQLLAGALVGGRKAVEQPAGGAGEHARVVELLDERLRFETLLARLTATFIHLPVEEIDGQIQRGLQQIVEFLGIDRSSLAQFSEDGGRLFMTHSYSVPGVEPFPQVDLAVHWPWYADQIRRGNLLRYSRLPDEAPPEAAREREYCRHSGLRSHLAIPFQVGEAVLGGIGFGSFRRERDWPDALVQSLQLVAAVFATALARKRAEEHEAHLREQLAQAVRVMMMGELAASIAHEVNQPLCAIVSNAQALQRMVAGGAGDPAEVREALQDISQDGQRASAVIARIRAFVQKGPARRAAVDVNHLVREAAALVRGDLARRRVAVRLELAGALPAVVGDAVQLQQVVLNLVANAADAMAGLPPQAREVVIRSGTDEAGDVTVAVADAGVGLGPGDNSHLFDAFFTTKPGGMGMGLAISKSIVQAHRGSIRAWPNAGRGATVQFTLPARAEDAP